VETLFSYARIRISHVHIADLKGGPVDVGSGVQHHSISPTHGEHVIVAGDLGSPCPSFVEFRLRVLGHETLELGSQ
jgi:hypothetical protein